MAIKNYSKSDIVQRVVLTLPSKFDVEDTTDVYAFYAGLSEALYNNTNLLDELFKQTNLISATGQYVDDFITDSSGLGRKVDETDEEYRQRYFNLEFKYNCTKSGIKNIVIDLLGYEPFDMFNSIKRGAYTNSRYYYNDPDLLAVYGGSTPCAGYIQFTTKPDSAYIEELCKTINAVKAAGITIYLYYPEPVTPPSGYGVGMYGIGSYGA